MSVIRVNVAGRIFEYPEIIAAYGDFVASGGQVQMMRDFVAHAKVVMFINAWVKAIDGWVIIDDSGVAYRVRVEPTGQYAIIGAAPMAEVRDVYIA